MARCPESRKGDVSNVFRTYANQAEALKRQGRANDLSGYEALGSQESQQIVRKAALAPRGDPDTALSRVLGPSPHESSSGMPAARSPAGETGAARMTPKTSMPPSTQPTSGRLSAPSVSPSSTTRPITPPSREEPANTFTSAITKTPEGWDEDVEELNRIGSELVQPYGDVRRPVQREVSRLHPRTRRQRRIARDAVHFRVRMRAGRFAEHVPAGPVVPATGRKVRRPTDQLPSQVQAVPLPAAPTPFR